MSGRIWPGALCRWVAAGENYGRIVVAERLAVNGERFAATDGTVAISVPSTTGPHWVVSCQSALSWTAKDQVQRWFMKRAAAEWMLAPLLPPPGTASTEDRAPCELQPGEIVGV